MRVKAWVEIATFVPDVGEVFYKVRRREVAAPKPKAPEPKMQWVFGSYYGKANGPGTVLTRAYVALGETPWPRARSFQAEKVRARRKTRRVVRQLIHRGIDPGPLRYGVSSWMLS